MNKPRIAIQGTKASFHEEAAFKYFGNEIEVIECDSFKKTFDMLKEDKADYVVMAIENSIAGSLLPNYNLLQDFRFPIMGEVYLRIQLHLMAYPGVKIEDIRHVESHPIALRQCADFLEEYPQIKATEGMDTAACAKKISELQLKDTAAVANRLASELYGLNILDSRIETIKKNYTRFLILAAEAKDNPKADKASLSFQTGNLPGSQGRILNTFAEQKSNLNKIHSMPVLGRRDEYIFHVDIDWKNRKDYDNALQKVLKHTINFNILGEYQKNDEI